MFQQLVVPVDGSEAAWAAVPIAARMAAAVDGGVQVITVVDRLGEVAPAQRDLDDGIDRLGDLPVGPTTDVLANDDTAFAIAERVEQSNGATVMMGSHGHGRSAAVLGSTTDDVLRRLYGPVVVIGPHVTRTSGELGGTYVVPVDGSKSSEQIIPIAEAWAIEFEATPWLVEVVSPDVQSTGDVLESAYAARVARRMQRESHREIEYEVLHDRHPAEALVDFADRNGASLLFVSTHGRTGMERLRLGSVAADIVRHAPCPVVLHRPPHLAV